MFVEAVPAPKETQQMITHLAISQRMFAAYELDRIIRRGELHLQSPRTAPPETGAVPQENEFEEKEA